MACDYSVAISCTDPGVSLLYKGWVRSGQADAAEKCMMAHRNPGVAVWLWMAALTTTAMTHSTLLPAIPASQESSSLANLWKQGLRNLEKSGDHRGDKPIPKTFVSPPYGEVMNWVPQDSGHPLYLPKNADFLREILLDYMTEEEVKPDDPRLSQPNGLEVTNLNRKPLTFTRDAADIKVNGVTVNGDTINADGTVSYVLEESLFNHRQRVHDAWKEMPKSHFGPFGPPPTGPPPLPTD